VLRDIAVEFGAPKARTPLDRAADGEEVGRGARHVQDALEPQLVPEVQLNDDVPNERGLVPVTVAERDGHVRA